MGGTLMPEDTPGGGLTMVVSLPAAPVSLADSPGKECRTGQEAWTEV
jgi:two-component system sensor histidine kinase KdpD